MLVILFDDINNINGLRSKLAYPITLVINLPQHFCIVYRDKNNNYKGYNFSPKDFNLKSQKTYLFCKKLNSLRFKDTISFSEKDIQHSKDALIVNDDIIQRQSSTWMNSYGKEIRNLTSNFQSNINQEKSSSGQQSTNTSRRDNIIQEGPINTLTTRKEKDILTMTKIEHDELKIKFRCNSDEDQEKIKDYLKDLLDNDSEDSMQIKKLVEDVINGSESLSSKFFSRWEEKKKAELAEKEKILNGNLNDLNNKISEREKDFNELEKLIDEEKEKILNCKKQHNSHEEELKKISDRFHDKIEKAKQNFTEFIAEKLLMESFPFSLQESSHSVSTIAQTAFDTIPQPSTHHAEWYFCENFPCHYTRSPREGNSFADILINLEENLSKNGGTNHHKYLVFFLTSAFLKQQDLFFIGAQSLELATIFSLSFYGETPAVLKCFGQRNEQAVIEVFQSSKKVIIIENPLSQDWLQSANEFNYRAKQAKKILIWTQPIADDLMIESASIFHFAIPVSTDLFLETSEEKYTATVTNKKLPEFKLKNCNDIELPRVPGLHITKLFSNKMKAMISCSKYLYDNLKNDSIVSNLTSGINMTNHNFEFLFYIYPMLYKCENRKDIIDNLHTSLSDLSRGISKIIDDMREEMY